MVTELEPARSRPDERAGTDIVDHDEPPADGPETERRHLLALFLTSFAALVLEISYTRVVSFKLFYYYTYLIIGLALLGMGSGAVFVTVSRKLRRARTETILRWGGLLGAIAVIGGYVLVSWIDVDTRRIWHYGSNNSMANMAALLLLCLGIYAPFAVIGTIVATVFGRRPERIGRLYFADLFGAAVACGLVVFLIKWITPPGAIMLAGVVLAAVCPLQLRRIPAGNRWVPVGAAALGVVLLVGVVSPGLLPDPRVDPLKSPPGSGDADYHGWSPIFRVDAVRLPTAMLLFHDGLAGSAIHKYNGKVSSLAPYRHDIRSFPFVVSGKPLDKEMIIGAAGGHEILPSLYYKAKRINAVELNDVTYSLVKHRYADFDGHIAEQPGVHYVLDDGRSYLERSSKDYNLIWYPAPDSYAASNASAAAFVLSESYLYTREAVEDSLKHLTSGGLLCTQFGEVDYADKPNRTARYLVTARAALENMGVKDPARNIVVLTSPYTTTEAARGVLGQVSTILVKRTPFTPAELKRLVAHLGSVPGTLVQYAPGHPQSGPIGKGLNGVATAVVTLPKAQQRSWLTHYAYDVHTVTDNKPYFWHFSRFKSVVKHIDKPIDTVDPEAGTGERVLLLLLAIAALLAAVFLLVPFLAIRRTWSRLPDKGMSAVYFAALGLGFMCFEIPLIQHLTLFLGYPTYSLTVTLASLLLFTGVGALTSERYAPRSWNHALPVLGGLLALALFYLYGLPPIIRAMFNTPLSLRILVTFVMLAPLGLLLGMFMPIGLRAVSRRTNHPSEYVAWGWAVNGFASVIASVLVTILSMSFGFSIVMGIGVAIYAIAFLPLRLLLGKQPAPSTG